MRKALAQPHTKQFLKFAVVGLISFGIDWGMLIALVELFHLDFLMSTTVSFITSVVVNYWLSMKYVFDHHEGMAAAVAAFVQRMGHQFLAGAGFPVQQHGRIGRRHA